MKTTVTCTMASEERLETFETVTPEGPNVEAVRKRVPVSVYHGHFSGKDDKVADALVKVANSAEPFVLGRVYEITIEPA